MVQPHERGQAGGLTSKQKAFVQEYLKDLNATQAAIRAGYAARTANREGSRLLSKAVIQKGLSEALATREVEARVESERLEREAERISTSDIRRLYDSDGRFLPIQQIPDDLAAAIASMETVSQEGDNGVERIRRVKFWDKNSAHKTLFRLRGEGKVNDRNVNFKGEVALVKEYTSIVQRMTQAEVDRYSVIAQELLDLYERVQARISGEVDRR